MEPTLLYLGKVIICSAVMFAYYLLFLKDKTFHHYNRFYLLLSVIISLVLPLIKVSYFTIETNKNLYLLLSQFNQNQLQTTANYDITIYSIFYAITGVVSVALLIRLIIGILKINSMKNKFPNETIKGINFYQTNLNNAPFSFFKNLFWKRSIEINSPVGQQILKHEMVHIEQKHSWDKLLMQVVKSIFWFNPVFYFISKEINLIHEYLADKKAVKKSGTKAFAQMLLESHFSGSVLPVTSPFLSSNLKKRLTMLTKNKTKYSYARKLFALPILFLMVFAYMVNAKNIEIKETNKAIELAVEQLKMDTIKPSSTAALDSLAKDHQSKVKMHGDALQEDNLKIAALSKKINEKSQQLKALSKAKKTDSPEFEALENEIDQLGTQIDGIVSSDNFKINQKELEKNAEAIAKIYDSPEWNKRYADIEKKANSPEFKKRIADAEKRARETEKMLNSPEFKKRIADADKRAKEAEARVNSPEFQKMIQEVQKRAQEVGDKFGKIYTEEQFQKMIKDQYGKNAFSDGTVSYGRVPTNEELKIMRDLPSNFTYSFSDDFFFNNAKSNLTPKELRKLEKKRKELKEKQKELQEDQKKLWLKQQELNKEMWQNRPRTISFKSLSDSPRSKVSNVNVFTAPQRVSRSNQVIILDNDGLASNDNLTNIYINGKLTDRVEIQKIDPNLISSMSVIKNQGGKSISIITK